MDSQGKEIYSVGQLTLLIKNSLEEKFRDFWVEGEISNVKKPASGHLYFTLKDSISQIRVVMFRSMGRVLRFTPKDGQSVLCRGRISVYEPRGDYQIIAEYLEPKGIGALQLAFQELKERLFREGLFDESKKKPLPIFPHTVGVITSASGAAIHDILNILERRRGGLRVILCPVRVQGEGSANEIAEAIQELNNLRGVDVLIVGRGGGSLEDLWAFNEEIVARAIFHSRLPVISAVGHETDFTISDFVSDVRAPTPSAAAELVSNSCDEWVERFQTLLLRLSQGALLYLEREKNHLREQMKGLQDPKPRIEGYLQRLDELDGRMRLGFHHVLLERRRAWGGVNQGLRLLNPVEVIRRSSLTLTQGLAHLVDQIQGVLEKKKQIIAEVMARLNALSPLSVLERGYSISWHLPSMEVLNDTQKVQVGDRVKIRLFRGEIQCRTEKIFPEELSEDQRRLF